MGKTTNITRKIQIYVNQPDSEKKKEQMNQIIYWCKHSRNYANKIMSFLHSVSFMGYVVKNVNPEIKGSFYDYIETSQRNVGYKTFANEYKGLLPSSFRSSINSSVYKKFSSSYKDVLIGKSSLPTFKSGYPIQFMKNSVRNLTSDGFDFHNIPLKFRYGRDRSDNRSIVDKIILGEYNMTDSSMVYDFESKKLFLLLGVKIPIQTPYLDQEKIMGVDLGLTNPAYITISGDDKFRLSLGSRESLLGGRVYIQKQMKSLYKSLKFIPGGRGRKRKLKKINSFRKKERNYVKNQNHVISKHIVEMARKKNCSAINIEDLSGIGKDVKNKFVLRNWSYYELQQMIKNKSKKYGIAVNMVDARYTSQRCSNCGHIHSDNRLTQSEFECVECGFKENADYNASRNIAIAHTPEFKKEIKKHKKKVDSLKK